MLNDDSEESDGVEQGKNFHDNEVESSEDDF